MPRPSTHTPNQALSLDVSGLAYRYRGADRDAVQEVSFSAEPGEWIAIVGPNGSGKSTLLRMLATELPPREVASWRIAGHPASARTDIRRKLGVVFQSGSLDPELTVRENYRHHARLFGVPSSALQERLPEALSAAGLEEDVLDRPCRTLSGGQRRRAELARALLHQPELLLLDEPTVGLDPPSRDRWWETLTGLRGERGPTVIWTTHHFDEAERADRVGVMDQGRLLAFNAPSALMADIPGQALTLRLKRSCSAETAWNRMQAIPGLDGLTQARRIMVGHELALVHPGASAWLEPAMQSLGADVESAAVSPPSMALVYRLLTAERPSEA